MGSGTQDRAAASASPGPIPLPDDVLTPWLTAALAEYQTLRAESLQAQSAQQTVLQFGITGVAVLIGLSLQLENRVLSVLLLLYLVPLVSVFIVSAWFTEIFRSLRAGNFLADVERKINGVLQCEVPALEWETWLRQPVPERRMFGRTRMSFAVLCVLNVAGFVLAGYLATTADLRVGRVAVIALGLGGIALLITSIVTYWRYEGRFDMRPTWSRAAGPEQASVAEASAARGK